MTVSQNFFDLVEGFEGIKLNAYQDQSGNWTIGYGTTHYPDGSPVSEGDTCTRDQAIDWLNSHIQPIQDLLSSIDGLAQQQFDSLADFCYNDGEGNFEQSTLKKDIEAGNADADKIKADFEAWDKERINGVLKPVKGLLRRRLAESYLYANGVNSPDFCTSEVQAMQN
jgi:lysozyme